MRRGIVIASCAKTARTWLPDCLESLGAVANVPIVVSYSTPARNEYDVSALRVGVAAFDEFWMMPDTCIVKDCRRLLDHLGDEGQSYAMGPNYISCIGKVVSASAERFGLPAWPRNKIEAVGVEARWFPGYAKHTKARVLDNGFVDGPRFEERHGRLNMVLESYLLLKFKGTWDLAMIGPEDRS